MLQEFVTIADQRFHVLFPNSKIHPVGKKGYTRNRIDYSNAVASPSKCTPLLFLSKHRLRLSPALCRNTQADGHKILVSY